MMPGVTGRDNITICATTEHSPALSLGTRTDTSDW